MRRKPGEWEYAVYVDGKCRRRYFGVGGDLEIMLAESSATRFAHTAWTKDESREVTIVRVNDTSIDAINFWFPIYGYPEGASSYIDRKVGRLISYRRGGGEPGTEFGRLHHHWSLEGENRFLRVQFGTMEKVLEYHRDIGATIFLFRRESGAATVVGSGTDVTISRAAQSALELPTPEEALEQTVQLYRAKARLLAIDSAANRPVWLP